MNPQDHFHGLAIRGTIRRRLLVNALVDPDEAAERLPAGLRPHVIDGRTVVGCCLLEIEAIRPAGWPRAVGMPLRAAAHRISVEWGDERGGTVAGVYVPVRHTDSHSAVLIGGRGFPGVHRPSTIEISASESTIGWRSEPIDSNGLGVRVIVSVDADGAAAAIGDEVGATCLGASVGLSFDHRGRLEAARMDPSHRDAREVTVELLESEFLDSFATAEQSRSYLMSDAEVRWTRAQSPTPSLLEVGA